MSETRIYVVTTRHPDAANETQVFGHPEDATFLIDLDLGSNFDTSKLGEGDLDNVVEWASHHFRQLDDMDAPEDVRQHVNAVVWQVLGDLPQPRSEILRALAGAPRV